MNDITVLSLFDGIGGGRIALERAGIKIDKYFASEIDSNAIKICQKNWDDIIEIGDIRCVDGKLYENKLDLLCGGSPCQNFSFAGTRKGAITKDNIEITTLEQYLELKKQGFEFEGQSYLFWEYIRILKESKPKYFLLENVKMTQKWKNIITETLGVEPIRLNSNLVSAQNRDRLYWTNINNGVIDLPNDKGLILSDIIDENSDIKKYELSVKHKDAFLKSYNWKPCMLDGKSKPLLATYYKQPPHCPYIPSKVSDSGYRRLSPLECERLQTLPDNYTKFIGDIEVSDTQRYKTIGNGWTIDVIAHIFSFLDFTE